MLIFDVNERVHKRQRLLSRTEANITHRSNLFTSPKLIIAADYGDDVD